MCDDADDLDNEKVWLANLVTEQEHGGHAANSTAEEA